MTTGAFASARPRAARRIAIAFAIAGTLTFPVAVSAEVGGPPPIAIPPAQSAVPAPESPATVQPVAASLLPGDVQVLRDSQGAGIAMYGALGGKAASALGVVLGIFAYSQAFDSTPALLLVLADQRDQHAQALFTGSVRGQKVIGVAVVSLDDTGGDVSVFYDASEAFSASFTRMRQALAQSGGVGTVVLAPISLGDGSQIAIPPGWRVIGQGKGSVDLLGPQGESLSLGATMPVSTRPAGDAGSVLRGPCCDPVRALQAVFPQLAAIEQRMGLPVRQLTDIVEAQPTPAPDGGDGAFILGNLSVGGRPYSYFALASAIAGFIDPWTFTLSGAMAPQPAFAAEFPTLLRIWRSYSANSRDFADRLQAALPGMDATRQIVKSTIAARVTAEYNADRGWDAVISGVAAAGDGRDQIDDAAAQKLADGLSSDTGRPWRIVPPSELK